MKSLFCQTLDIAIDDEIVQKLKQIINWDENKSVIKPNETVNAINTVQEKAKVFERSKILDTPVPKKFPDKINKAETEGNCSGDTCIPCMMPRPSKMRRMSDSANVPPEVKKKRKMIHPPKQLLRVNILFNN